MALDFHYQQSLVKTKYTKPVTNSHLIPRLHITDKLNRAFDHKVTLISAPAGYGKSTAALEWIKQSKLTTAWVSLDLNDNDPIFFWSYICAALNDIVEDLSQDTAYIFHSVELLNTDVHVNILIDKLNAVDSDFFLCLDDFHLITESRILKQMSYLINYLPPKMHVILISRSEPDIDLAKLEIKGDLARLTASDLLFRHEEISKFYAARGFLLEAANVESIERYSEGWAAALVAVVMSLEADKNLVRLKRSIAYAPSIEQYLEEEVLNRWSDEKIDFFLKTSILDALCAELCDAVTGQDNSSRLLKKIYNSNGYLLPIDNENGWYRYHHIFRDFLQKRLSDSNLDSAYLHRKAAEWFQENGYPRHAVDHFLLGKHYEAAVKQIEDLSDSLVTRGDYSTVFTWLGRLPEEYQNTSIRIAIMQSLYHAEIGHFDQSQRWIDRMEDIAGVKFTAEEDNIHTRTLIDLARANLAGRKGDIAGLFSIINTAVDNGAAQHYQFSGFMDVNFHDIYFYRSPMNQLTTFYGTDPEAFNEPVAKYRTLIKTNPGYAPLAAGEYLYETDRLEEALPHLLSAMEEATEACCPGALVPAMVTIARINKAWGDLSGAFEAVKECEARLRNINQLHWNYLLEAFKARLSLESGDTNAVETWFDSCKLGIYQEITRTREFELLVLARFLISKNRLGEAIILLKRLLAFTEGLAQKHSTVEVLNLLAVAAYKKGNYAGTAGYLEKSIGIGMEEDYLRSFIDEMEPMKDLLSTLVVKGKQQKAYIQKIQSHAGRSVQMNITSNKNASSAHPGRQLTPQELKVLRLVADGFTNHEIAEHLGISLSTVKAHATSIYSKLQVKTRVQCINQARESSLI